jgi:hypothetical protein
MPAENGNAMLFPVVCTGFGDNLAGRVHAAPRNGGFGMVVRKRHR